MAYKSEDNGVLRTYRHDSTNNNWIAVSEEPLVTLELPEEDYLFPPPSIRNRGCGCGAFRFVNKICVYCGGSYGIL